MKQVCKKTLALLLTLCVLTVGGGAFLAYAGAPNGIKNNGLYGINIDINASPYSDSKFNYGNAAYTNLGCAWFAASRAYQLNGNSGITTWSAANWWNNGSGRCGFKTYSDPLPYSIVCYGGTQSNSWGHVLIIEKEVDDCYVISEGGTTADGANSSNGYCRIGIIAKKNIKTYCPNYLGCVCFNRDPMGAVDEISSKSAGTVYVYGWAIDFDSAYENIPLHVYIGEGSGEECHVIQTGKTRTDIGYGNQHGFDETITTSKTGTQPVRVYAINTPYGNNPLLGSGTVNIPSNKTYAVSFNANGGTCSTTSKIVTYNSTYGTLPEPSRRGYTFDGWYTSASGGTEVTPSTKVTATVAHTLYAYWTANNYTSKVYAAYISGTNTTYTQGTTGGSAGFTSACGYAENSRSWTYPNAKFTIYAKPAAGYHFVGWYWKNNGMIDTGAGIDDGFYASDCTYSNGVYSKAVDLTGENLSTGRGFTAKFAPNAYTIKFSGNGATSGSMSDQSFTYDTAQALNANAFKRVHTVTYSYNGATGGNSATSATATATFNGWATSTSGAKVYSDKQSVQNLATSGTVSLYANWTLDTVTPPTPTKTGFTFKGWNTKADGTGTPYAAGTAFKPTADVTLYAQWMKNAATLTGITIRTLPDKTAYAVGDAFDQTGLTLTAAYSDNSTQIVTSGFACAGFSSATAGTKTITVTYSGKSATFTVTVKQTPTAQFTLTYDANGGSGAPAQQTGNGTVTLSSEQPTREGYTFLGWAANSSATKAQYASGAPFDLNRNVTLYAVWQASIGDKIELSIASPATATYKKPFSMSVKTSREVPEGARFEWTTTNTNARVSMAADKKSCTVTPLRTGNCSITVTLYSASNEKLAAKTQTVPVRYAWWQWLILIFLFGWIWY